MGLFDNFQGNLPGQENSLASRLKCSFGVAESFVGTSNHSGQGTDSYLVHDKFGRNKIIYAIKPTEQTEEAYLEAVGKNSLSMVFVEHQTKAICMAAVEQNRVVLEFVKRQFPEVCLAAVKQTEAAYCFIKDVNTRKLVKRTLVQEGLLREL